MMFDEGLVTGPNVVLVAAPIVCGIAAVGSGEIGVHHGAVGEVYHNAVGEVYQTMFVVLGTVAMSAEEVMLALGATAAAEVLEAIARAIVELEKASAEVKLAGVTAG